ncbi:MAG: hypothetical protein MUE69_10640 [Myxococcota bacterium]|jgi:RHS repeat-associated protein|nr:hypothetical protein [Myxococcota bacterium]
MHPFASARLAVVVVALGSIVCPNLTRADDDSGVSPNRLKLPSGPGSLEGVGEDAELNPNMGVATYRVPIEVPRGHHGFGPELALTYSSTSGASVVGFGWDLAIPSIERMTSRGLPSYDTSDLFAAGGGEELVRLPGTSTYRARFERAFVRYTWRDSGDGAEGHWVAEYPDGRVGYFGADADGRIDEASRTPGRAGTFAYHLVEMRDVHGHRIEYDYERHEGTPYLTRIVWAHESGGPRYVVELAYEDRPDRVIDGKPGRLITLARRVRDVRVRVGGALLRRYQLTYENQESAGGLSRLLEVTRFGTSDRNAYPVRFRFGYTRGFDPSCAAADCVRPYVVSVEGAVGADFRTGEVELLDLNGDALPDVVNTEGGRHRVSTLRLQADGRFRFAPAFVSARAGSGAMILSSPNVQLVDVDADGFVDMVDGLNARTLRSLGSGDWTVDEAIARNLPDFGADANLRFLDVDYDRHIDAVHLGRDASWVFYNRDGVFSGAVPIAGVEREFVADGLQLADLNGDGLLDAAQVVAGAVFYWPNLGRGVFGGAVEMLSLPVDFSADQVRLHDLNGDGLADAVVVAGTEVVFALNQNGVDFGARRGIRSDDVDGSIPERTSDTSVRFADMNASGSVDVVWITSSGAMTFLELFPERPNLLTRVDNGIGQLVELSYGSTVEDMARDGGPEAWSHRLPHPMQVVREIRRYDTASGVRQTRRLRYRDGYYDGVEHQFRGFAHVELTHVGDESVEERTSVYAFDLGVEDRYRHGLLLELEERGQDRSLRATVTEHDDCALAGIPARVEPAIRFLCPRREVTTHREGLDRDAWVYTQKTFEHDGYGNVIEEHDLGVIGVGSGGCPSCEGRPPEVHGAPCDTTCRGDERHVETEYVAPGPATGERWILNAPFRVRTYGVEESAEVSETRTYYDGEPFEGLALGRLERGVVTRVEARRLAGSDDFVQRERHRLDEHGNVVETRDPNGHRRSFEYDAGGLLVLAEVIHFDDPGHLPYELRMEVGYHPVLETVSSSTAWMRVEGGAVQSERRETAYLHDEFGRPSATARPGDSLDAPTEVYTYELAEPISRITLRRRSTRGGALDLETHTCFDGLGRPLQTRTWIEPGRYQVDGWSTFNARAEVARRHQPHEDASAECARSAPTGVRYEQMSYDALARPTRTIHPDETIYGAPSESRVEHLPLRTVERDEEDTDPASAHFDTPTTTVRDGLGRIVSLTRTLQGEPPLVTSVRYDGLGHLRGYVDPQGDEKVQEHDLLGRVLRVVDVDSGETTFTYDDVGNVLSRTDARGATTVYEHDEANRIRAQFDADDPMRTRTAYHYDRPERCDSARCTFVEGQLAAVDYPIDGPTEAFGSDAFGFDERGRATHFARELDGHRFEVESVFDNLDRVVGRRFPHGRAVDYEVDGLDRVVAVPGYVDEVTFDARGDLRSTVFGNGVTTEYTHDARRRLETLVTASAEELLQDYTYVRDRIGNILHVQDRSAEEDTPSHDARHTYDALYRLTSSLLDAGRRPEETLSFVYDHGDNILAMESSLGPASAGHVGTYDYAPDRPHAVRRAGELEYDYDPAGHAIRRGPDHYRWDHLGRMRDAHRDGELLASFAYGAGVERVRKIEDHSTTYYVAPDYEVRDGMAQIYVRLGDRRVVRIEAPDWQSAMYPDLAPARIESGVVRSDGEGELRASDVWIAEAIRRGELEGERADALDAEAILRAITRRMVASPPPELTWFHHDHLGSVALSTDASVALLARSVRYAFGAGRGTPPPADWGSDYTGHERDISTGLSYAHARYLDTTSGRWMSPDQSFERLLANGALETEDAFRRFVYGSNRPTIAVDQDGRAVNYVLGAVVGGLISGSLEAAKQHIRGERLNWRAIGTAAAFGALTGFATGGVTTAKTIVDGVLAEVGKESAPIIAGSFARMAGASAETSKLVETAASAAFAIADVRATARKLENLDRIGNFAGSISERLRNIRMHTRDGLMVNALQQLDSTTDKGNGSLLDRSPLGDASERLGQTLDGWSTQTDSGGSSDTRTEDVP